MKDLGYFVGWGGYPWRRAVSLGVAEAQKLKTFSGASVLDFGTRDGRMAIYFSLLGAKATGVDINPLDRAISEAQRFGVRPRFITYDGNLDIFPDESFDFVFTKSTLAALRVDFTLTMRQIHHKLKVGGVFLCIENMRAGAIGQWLRLQWHQVTDGWDCSNARYFTNADIAIIGAMFEISFIKRAWLPPIAVVVGRKTHRHACAQYGRTYSVAPMKKRR